MPLTIYINGKFAAQRVTGVQRVGLEIVRALDRVLSDDDHLGQLRWVLLCPPGADAPVLDHVAVVVGPGRPVALHFWEQVVLPRKSCGGLLLNLAGTGPWLAHRQMTFLHDAAVFDHPQAYTRAFVAWYRCLFRRQAHHADVLFTVSAFSRGRLAGFLGVAPQRWRVVRLGGDHLQALVADDLVINRLGLAPARPFFLAVGSANPTKNLQALLRAYRRLGPYRPALVLVGGHNDRVFMLGQISSDPEGVVRAGCVDDASLKALYAHALALVFPSTYEGFGLPPLEAMSLGCPVVTTRYASIPEVCGEAALYVDPVSDEGLADAMRRIIHDPLLREQLRAAGHARAQAFSWDETARQLLRALHDEVRVA